MNKIDKIFHDKLAQHERPVSAEAWGRISNGLQSKKQKGIYFWMQLAAGLSLVAVAAAYLLLKDLNNGELIAPEIAQSEISKEPENIQEVEIAEVIALPQLHENANTITPEANQSKQIVVRQSVKPNQIAAENTKELIAAAEITTQQENIDVAEPAGILLTNLPDDKTALATELKAKPININIVLTGKATNSDLIASTSYQDEEKQGIGSKMKKIFDKAQEIKYSEGALADLRMAKDDFLSLDLKKEIN
jgi:hypothetical protein